MIPSYFNIRFINISCLCLIFSFVCSHFMIRILFLFSSIIHSIILVHVLYSYMWQIIYIRPYNIILVVIYHVSQWLHWWPGQFVILRWYWNSLFTYTVIWQISRDLQNFGIIVIASLIVYFCSHVLLVSMLWGGSGFRWLPPVHTGGVSPSRDMNVCKMDLFGEVMRIIFL